MTLSKTVYLLILLIFSSIPIAQAASERDLIIQKEMDSVSAQVQIVNKQMDQVQGVITPQNLTPQDVQTESPQIIRKKPKWIYEIAPEVSSIRYHEHALMKETGVMFGSSGSFTYRPSVGDELYSKLTDMYRFEGMFTYGKVDYKGGIQHSNGSITPERHNGIDDYMVEIRGLIGKDFNFNNQSTLLTPYYGGGYRSLFDTFYENKPFGYNRRIQYLYFPTGVEVVTQLHDGWSIGADAEYDFFIRGFVNSYLGEIGYGDIQNTQKGGYGLRGSIKLIKNSDRYNLYLEPFFRYWNIHASRIDESTPFTIAGQQFVLLGQEPHNTSLEIGTKVGIEF